MGDFKIPNLFKSWFFSAPGLRAWGGGGSPVSWFSSPERLPPHITAVSDLPTLCQGKKRIGRKGNSFACLALCPLVSVTSGYADYPDMTLSLLFFSQRCTLCSHISWLQLLVADNTSLALSALDKFPRTWTSGGSFSHWGMRRQGSFSNDHKPMLLMDSTLFPGTHYCLPPVS